MANWFGQNYPGYTEQREPGEGGERRTPGESGGNRTPGVGGTLACRGGRCQYVDAATPEAIQACKGKVEGDPCTPPTGTPVPNTGCPEGNGPAYTANPEACPCGFGYATMTGNCPPGYTFIARDPTNWTASDIPSKPGAKGTCECNQAIADWKARKKGTGVSGEFNWSSGLSGLWNQLLERAGGVMNMPYGFSQQAKDYMFGKNFEKIRGQESAERESTLNALSRMGLLGTGAELGTMGKMGWDTERKVTDLMRDLFVAEEEKKKQDLLQYTGLAQNIFGSGIGMEQLKEALNAARRGERSNALMMLMQIFGLL